MIIFFDWVETTYSWLELPSRPGVHVQFGWAAGNKDIPAMQAAIAEGEAAGLDGDLQEIRCAKGLQNHLGM